MSISSLLLINRYSLNITHKFRKLFLGYNFIYEN